MAKLTVVLNILSYCWLIFLAVYSVRAFYVWRRNKKRRVELKWFGAKNGDEFKVDSFATYHFYEDSNDAPDNGGDVIEPHDGAGVWVKCDYEGSDGY